MTHQKRVLTAEGVKPICPYQHKYQYLYLWGCFSPITGEGVYLETDGVNNQLFELHLKQLSQHNPDEFKIVLIDNAGFHSTKNISIPHNIHLLPIPPYSPELNPAEKVWQWMKDQVAMKVYKDTTSLQKQITKMVIELDKQRIISLTSYKQLIQPFMECFNV